MLEINEISRFDQLVGNGPEIVAQAMLTYGIDFESLVSEIATQVNNVPAVTASESAAWYIEANEFAVKLAAQYEMSVSKVAGVIAAVSPRMPWLRNKKVAEAIVSTYAKYDDLSAIDAAKEIGLALSANVAMAVKICRGEAIADVLTGTKRRSFYNNIVAPSGIDSVTVDTWMMVAYCNVASVDKKTAEKFIRSNETALGGTGAGYFVIAEAVREVARTLNMTANAIQAVYWVAVSGSFNGGREDIN